MAKRKETSDEPSRSLEEVAREAMDAIKEAERKAKNREEAALKEEMLAKEAALKEEVERKLKRKLRRLEKEESQKPKEDEADPRYIVNWKNIDKFGITYEGRYNDKYTFRIKKGLYLYHLFVEDKDLMIESWQRSTCTSSSLDSLKEKADKILNEAKERAENVKKEKLKSMILIAKSNYLSKDGTIKKGQEIDGKFYAPKDDV